MINFSVKLLMYAFVTCFISIGFLWISKAAPLELFNNISSATEKFTQNSQDVLNTSTITGNPIINGTDEVTWKGGLKWSSEWILGIITINTSSYTWVLSQTMQKIQNVVNRTLGLVALICVIYLVYNGVLLLVKFDDEKAQSDALESIKQVAWVIWGIWLTWFIVSTLFYIIALISKPS